MAIEYDAENQRAVGAEAGSPPIKSGAHAPNNDAPLPKSARLPLGKRISRWLFVTVGVTALLLLGYRWAGTSTLRGSVQRVYEKESHYRIEFVEASGEVHVLENEVIKFPHIKTDTADLQATLHRYSKTGDVIDVTTWGLRASFISLFPNVVGVEFVQSNQVRKKQHVDYVTQSVIDELIDQGVVQRGAESERMRPGLGQAIERATIDMDPGQKDAEPRGDSRP